MDNVVNLLSAKFKVNPVTGDIYEIFNIMGDSFGRAIRQNDENSKLELLNFPYSEPVETDIKEIEKMLMRYQRNEELRKLWRAGIEEFRRNNIRDYPHLFYFLYDLIRGVIKYTFRREI